MAFIEPGQEPVADRAAFERHAERLGYSVDPDTREGREGGYWSSHTQLMWLTWQAALAEPVQEPATLPGPGLVMCPACCAQFDPALNSVQPVQEPVAQRGAMFRTHPAVERQRSVEAAVRPACGVDPAAKAQPVQEPKPVAWRFEARHIDSAWAAAVTLKHPGPEGIYMRNVMPLYAHPPQRLPLTDEEIERLWYPSAVIAEPGKRRVAFGRAVERAHGIGGEG